MSMKIPAAALLLAAACTLAATGCGSDRDAHHGHNWLTVAALSGTPGAVSVAATGPGRVQIGDSPHFGIHTNTNGRLWVVQVDSSDHLAVLYPTTNNLDNSIHENTVVDLPPPNTPWVAAEPAGDTLVTFVVTAGDGTLDQVLSVAQGRANTPKGLATPATWGATSLKFTITPASGGTPTSR